IYRYQSSCSRDSLYDSTVAVYLLASYQACVAGTLDGLRGLRISFRPLPRRNIRDRRNDAAAFVAVGACSSNYGTKIYSSVVTPRFPYTGPALRPHARLHRRVLDKGYVHVFWRAAIFADEIHHSVLIV